MDFYTASDDRGGLPIREVCKLASACGDDDDLMQMWLSVLVSFCRGTHGCDEGSLVLAAL
jgi:hypothetical protein